MSGCQTCGGFGMHHDPIAHDAELVDLLPPESRVEVRRERELLAQGICPRTGESWACPGTFGTPRSACAICDCGDPEPEP